MNLNTFKRICQPIRITLGLALISYGIYSANALFFLGAIPLIAGMLNFCPLCIITKKCSI